MTLQLTPEVIAMAKKEVDIEQYYDVVEAATPKHIAFKDFIDKTKWKGLPKVIYYILMDELFPVANAANGDLGYRVELKPEIHSTP